MPAILPELRYAVKERLLRNLRRCRDARLRCHYLIVITLNEGLTVATVARGGTDYTEFDWAGPIALVLGNEATGLDDVLAEGVPVG